MVMFVETQFFHGSAYGENSKLNCIKICKQKRGN